MTTDDLERLVQIEETKMKMKKNPTQTSFDRWDRGQDQSPGPDRRKNNSMHSHILTSRNRPNRSSQSQTRGCRSSSPESQASSRNTSRNNYRSLSPSSNLARSGETYSSLSPRQGPNGTVSNGSPRANSAPGSPQDIATWAENRIPFSSSARTSTNISSSPSYVSVSPKANSGVESVRQTSHTSASTSMSSMSLLFGSIDKPTNSFCSTSHVNSGDTYGAHDSRYVRSDVITAPTGMMAATDLRPGTTAPSATSPEQINYPIHTSGYTHGNVLSYNGTSYSIGSLGDQGGNGGGGDYDTYDTYDERHLSLAALAGGEWGEAHAGEGGSIDCELVINSK